MTVNPFRIECNGIRKKTLDTYTYVAYNDDMERASHIFEDPVATVGFRQIQITGPAWASLAVALLRRVLADDPRPAAWILREGIAPFAPDLVDAGLRPERMLYLRAEDDLRADKAADTVLRSGQFSCLVYELSGTSSPEPGVISRFMHLCRRYRSTMILIGPDRSAPTVATAAVHLDTEVRYAPARQLIRITVRRSRMPLADCEIPAYGPDHLY